MSTQHQHQAIGESEPRGYTGSVAVHPYTAENRAAHGNIEVTERCACGAERDVLVNQMHHEYGPWHEGEEQRRLRLAREASQSEHRRRVSRAAAFLRGTHRSGAHTYATERVRDVRASDDIIVQVEVAGDVRAEDLARDDTPVLLHVRREADDWRDEPVRRTTTGELREACADWADAPESEAHAVYRALYEAML